MKPNEELLSALKQFIECWEDTKASEEMENEDHPFETEDDAELALINEQLIAMMERNGFTDISTGGGCEAWSKDLLPDGSLYMLVTVGMDGLTYQELADAHQQQITACVYMKNGEWLDASQQHFTWEEFKAVMKVSI